jgi:hypothetical protein
VNWERELLDLTDNRKQKNSKKNSLFLRLFFLLKFISSPLRLEGILCRKHCSYGKKDGKGGVDGTAVTLYNRK